MSWEIGKHGSKLGQDGLTEIQRKENKNMLREMWDERKKILINISNHPSNLWTKEQKGSWKKIIDIKFPDVPAESSSNKVYTLIDNLLNEEIYPTIERVETEGEVFFMLQGEFSFCYKLLPILQKIGAIAVPTTKREVVEKDGIKTSIFKFVRWRII